MGRLIFLFFYYFLLFISRVYSHNMILMKSAWWDMDKRGRRWESIFKRMEKQFWEETRKGNHDKAEGYFRRMSIIEKLIQPYVQEVTGLRKIISLHNKKYPELSQT